MKTHFSFDVFLSHNSADKFRVRTIADKLRAVGLRVWFDEWVIKPGDDIYLSIERGLEESRTLVLCLSPAALRSDWVGLERSTAIFRDPSNITRRFIPILLADCELPDTLRRFKFIDYRGDSDSAIEEIRAAISLISTELEKRLNSVPISSTAQSAVDNFGFAINRYLFELDRLYVDSRINEYYVPLSGFIESEDGTRQKVTPEIHLDSWLSDRSRRFLALLGDYGTGKSWFCLRIAKRLADTYRKATNENPLPLLITFKRFNPSMNLEDLIKDCLLDSYGVELRNPFELRKGIQSGRIFLILDGLDEMAKVLGERTALVAFTRLGLGLEIPKVLITCRTHYFYSGSEQRELLCPSKKHSSIINVPMFELFHLSLLDGIRVRECIKRHFDPSKAEKVFQFVKSTYNLNEICARPVLLSLVCESFDLLPNFNEVSSSSELYEAYIDSWLHRELRDGRLFLDPDLVKSFFDTLAEEMVKTNTLIIEPARLKQHLSELLDKAGLPIYKWREVERQLITSTFVKRSFSDGWQFAHRSFEEYFYARKFFRWEIETAGHGEFPVTHTPIWQFIAQMVIKRWDEKKALSWIEPKLKRQDDPTLTKTTLRAAAAYRLLKGSFVSAKNFPLSGIMLDSVDLSNLNLRKRDLSDSDFHGSDLKGSNFSFANLCSSNLSSCLFFAANLQNAKLNLCDISNADFRGANFGHPKSKTWVNTIRQLKDCNGVESAIFDHEVNTYLR